MPAYDLTAPYSPKGDQPTAIKQLVKGVNGGERYQTLLGATGTGKTVVAAFDYARFRREAIEEGRTARLLFVAHRKEILEQSCACFRAVLRDQNFGELQVGSHQAADYEHWRQLGNAGWG